jgi:hypothetical protein
MGPPESRVTSSLEHFAAHARAYIRAAAAVLAEPQRLHMICWTIA